LRWKAPRQLQAPQQLIAEREQYLLCAKGQSLRRCKRRGHGWQRRLPVPGY
jgi:hypothetical protein